MTKQINVLLFLMILSIGGAQLDGSSVGLPWAASCVCSQIEHPRWLKSYVWNWLSWDVQRVGLLSSFRVNSGLPCLQRDSSEEQLDISGGSSRLPQVQRWKLSVPRLTSATFHWLKWVTVPGWFHVGGSQWKWTWGHMVPWGHLWRIATTRGDTIPWG